MGSVPGVGSPNYGTLLVERGSHIEEGEPERAAEVAAAADGGDELPPVETTFDQDDDDEDDD